MDDFKEMIAEFEREVLANLRESVLVSEKEIREVLTQAIWEAVYEIYEPTWYTRTYQLLMSVSSKIEGTWMYAYIDTNKLHYTSAVDGRNVTPAVPYWVQDGHDDDYAIWNQYHHYQGRDYLGLAQELFYEKYGIYPEIINEEPPQWY